MQQERKNEKWGEKKKNEMRERQTDKTAACLKYEVYENFLRGLSEICWKINGSQ